MLSKNLTKLLTVTNKTDLILTESMRLEPVTSLPLTSPCCITAQTPVQKCPESGDTKRQLSAKGYHRGPLETPSGAQRK